MSILAGSDAGAEPPSFFGPRSGYSTQIGFLVSQLNWMRTVVLSRLQSLSVEELDWRPHPDANSIGALLMHLAAADVQYGLNTFNGVPGAAFPMKRARSGEWRSMLVRLHESAIRALTYSTTYRIFLTHGNIPCRS